jgi:Domain of unknown function (DUF4186)
MHDRANILAGGHQSQPVITPQPSRRRLSFTSIQEKEVLVEEVDAASGAVLERKRVKLDCKSTRCDTDLHCFRKSRAMAIQGACRDCGEAGLVDWDRVRRRDPEDAAFAFAELEKEMVRHIYFHVPFDQHAINAALRKGSKQLYRGIGKRIHSAVGRPRHPKEGRQTEWSGNVYYYAQHATARCCRKCMEYWHGIAQGAELTTTQEAYLSRLVELYLDRRLMEQIPNLIEDGQHVAPIRKAKRDAKD